MTFQNPIDGERHALVSAGVPWVMEYDAATRAWKPIVNFEDVVAVTITGASIEITPGEFVQVTGSVAIWDPANGVLARISADGRLEVNVAGTITDPNQLVAAQYPEDSLHTSGQTGTFVLGVRQDSPTALAGAGDYIPFAMDESGRLHVFTSGSYVRLDSDIQIGAVEIKDGDTDNRARVTADGRVWVNALVTGTVDIALTTADEVTAYVTGTVDTELPAATTPADFIADPLSPAVQAFPYLYDQSNEVWIRARTVRDPDTLVVRSITGSFADTSFNRAWSNDTLGWHRMLRDLQDRLMVSALVSGTVTVAGTIAQSSQILPAQYAEDSLHASGETGTFVLAVRQDNPAALAGLGDYSPFATDLLGRLHVFTSGSFVQISSDIEIGAVEIKDADTDNRQRVSADGRAWVNALVTGTVSTELPASTTLALNQRADVAIASPVIVTDVDDQSPGTGVLTSAFLKAFDGDNWDRVGIDTTRRLMTSALVTGSVTVAGTVAVASQTLPAQYAEDSLHVSGETGTFVLGVRRDSPAALAGVGDYTPFLTDELGRLHTFTSGSFVQISSDIEIGAVEVKDADTDNRQRVTADGRAWVDALITGTVDVSLPASTTLALNQRADVAIASPVIVTEADNQSPGTGVLANAFLKAFDGDNWDRVGIDTTRRLMTSALVSGSVNLESGKTIQRAVINISGSGGEQTLVAAAGGSLKIKVLEVMLITDAAVKAFFQSGFTGTALTGPLSLAADGDGFFLNSPANRDLHHFETAANQVLVLDMSAVAAIGGWINYYTEA